MKKVLIRDRETLEFCCMTVSDNPVESIFWSPDIKKAYDFGNDSTEGIEENCYRIGITQKKNTIIWVV